MVYGFGLWCVAYGALLAWAELFASRKLYVRLWTVGVFATMVLGIIL